MIRALVFDFDGLILETEGPIFQSWQELYQEYGFELPLDEWSQIIGTADNLFDPLATLENKLGRRLEYTSVLPRRFRREQELILVQAALPGVEQMLGDARRVGLKVGLASSSPCSWVSDHLERLGLIGCFDAIRAREDVERTKPDPELYLSAAKALGVSPGQAVAFEDSPNGILAAKRAGMYCVAVPNAMIRRLSLDLADLQVASLACLPLNALLERFNGHRLPGEV